VKSEARKPLAERVIDDVGGAFTVGLAYIGDKLGLFVALAGAPRSTSAELAQRTGLDERYVREWLNGMVASRYVEHDPAGPSYFLDAEQKAAFVDEGGRTFVAGAFQLALPSLLLSPRLLELFRHGGGIPFAALSPEIPTAIDRMHRPWFEHLLVQEWLPAADEALYGLGGNQMGLLNLKGYDLDLWQHNGTIVIPFLVSSRGWGVLWDNTSFTRFGDLRQLEPIPAERLMDMIWADGLVGSSVPTQERTAAPGPCCSKCLTKPCTPPCFSINPLATPPSRHRSHH